MSTSCERSTNSSEATDGCHQLSSPSHNQTAGDRLLPVPFTAAGFESPGFAQHGDSASNLANIDVKREVGMESGDFPVNANMQQNKASAQGTFASSTPVVQSPACSPTTHSSTQVMAAPTTAIHSQCTIGIYTFVVCTVRILTAKFEVSSI